MDELQELTKEKVTEYENLVDEGNEKIKDLITISELSSKHLSGLGFMVNFHEYLDSQIQTYKNRNKICSAQIEIFQENCEHEFEYEGNDSHYRYDKCKFCGKVDKT